MYQLLSVLPVYNGEKYLGPALQSLADQELKPDKVILQDDGSTDRTEEIARSVKGLNLEIRRNERNQGLFANHNVCLQYATEATYLHLMHADDVLEPAFFKTLVAALEDVPALSFAWSNCHRIDGQGKVLNDIAPAAQDGRTQELSRDRFLSQRARLLPDLFLDAALIKCGGGALPSRFPLDLILLGDVVFWANLAVRAKAIRKVNRKLMAYRDHLESGSYRAAENIETYMEQDWRVIQQIHAMRQIGPMARYVGWQKLKCFYAALARTKAEMVKGRYPAMAHKALAAGRAHVHLAHWVAGGMAFYGRKVYRNLTRGANRG